MSKCKALWIKESQGCSFLKKENFLKLLFKAQLALCRKSVKNVLCKQAEITDETMVDPNLYFLFEKKTHTTIFDKGFEGLRM